MNELKPWYREPQFIITVLFNLYILIEYQLDPSIARSVVILYWWQSVVLGISHFIQLLTARQILPLEMNGVMRNDAGVKWFMSFFFSGSLRHIPHRLPDISSGLCQISGQRYPSDSGHVYDHGSAVCRHADVFAGPDCL